MTPSGHEAQSLPELPADVEALATAILLGPRSEFAPRFAELCRAHPSHRAALERLCADFERAACILDVPVAPMLPSAIGPYRFLRQIGEGAFGVVFLAEQRAPIRRQVAIKLLHGRACSKGAVDRFLNERETLARMNHPAIARIFDAGVEPEGRPYLVMEHVPGEPLHTFVRRRVPSLAERIGLFLEACEGVSHAHQRGVIHRDLKPQNVLVAEVDGRAVPKVIDFGLAKVFADDAERSAVQTIAGAVLGTPAYMSPEQVRGDAHDVDTRTDVYSLGVILYEVLAESLPFAADRYRPGTFSDLQRLIRDVEPPLASVQAAHGGVSHAARMRGDLDWILRKAMAKHRDERYGSVAEFAADLRRHLAHEPVLAGPPSVSYLVRKFVRRHRVQVAAAAVVLAVMLVGLVVGFGLYRRARASEVRATESLGDFWRLADVVELETLLAEEKELWPSTPERYADHAGWVERARSLVARRSVHVATLQELAGRLGSGVGIGAEELRGARFLHDRLEQLVADLASFAADGGVLARVAARAEFSRRVAEVSVEGARAGWDRAIAAVGRSQRYGGLRLRPIVGLVPLGPDPDSGLEEFAHLQSGAVPRRGADGRLVIDDDSGIVLVLIPGGPATLGSQSGNARGRHFDPHREGVEFDVMDAELPPFLIGKFELTQAQARALGLDLESGYATAEMRQDGRPFRPRSPETFMLGPIAHRWLPRFHLRMPSTFEWEKAARGGSGSVWVVGNESESLQGFANVADATWGAQEDPVRPWDDRLRDGFVEAAPVGSFRANGYGLHDVLGNVAELTDFAQDWRPYPGCLARGGSFLLLPKESRVGSVRMVSLTQTTPELGVRVARDVALE